MRQQHKAGEKMFVDYCDQILDFMDASTDQTRQAQIFVEGLGENNHTYAEACFSQRLPE